MCRGTVTIQDGQRGSLTKVTLTHNKEQMQSVTLQQLKERVVSEVPGIRGKKNNQVYNLTAVMTVTRIMVRFISKSAVFYFWNHDFSQKSNFCISLSCSDSTYIMMIHLRLHTPYWCVSLLHRKDRHSARLQRSNVGCWLHHTVPTWYQARGHHPGAAKGSWRVDGLIK